MRRTHDPGAFAPGAYEFLVGGASPLHRQILGFVFWLGQRRTPEELDLGLEAAGPIAVLAGGSASAPVDRPSD